MTILHHTFWLNHCRHILNMITIHDVIGEAASSPCLLVHSNYLPHISVMEVSFSLLLRENAAPIDGVSLCFGRERRWQHKQKRIKAATTKIKTPRKITMIEIEDILITAISNYLLTPHQRISSSHCACKLHRGDFPSIGQII